MTDAWAKYEHDPTAPKPKPLPRDWRNAQWGDVASSALRKVVPDYLHEMWTGIKGLPGAAQQFGKAMLDPNSASPEMRLLTTGPRTVMGLNPFAVSPARTALDSLQLGLGLNDYAYNNYTAPGALKQTLAEHPARPLMDAQALATIPEGGEGLALRAPGMAGKLARAGVRTAKTFNRATNPVALAGEATAAGAKGLQKALRGGSPLDKAGDFTPSARAAVNTAFPNGEITGTELADPKFKSILTDAFKAKGINPAAVREAVLTYHGAPTSKSVVMRQKVPGSLKGPVTDSVTDAKRAIGEKASAIAGAPHPDPSAVAGALDAAHTLSLADAVQKYEDLRKIPGSFGPSLDGPTLFHDVGNELVKHGIPSTSKLLARSVDAYPQANKAAALLKDALVDGNTRLGGEITAPELLEVRRQLTTLRREAKGSDIKAVDAIIDGFHKNIEDAGQAGKFVGPGGVPNPAIASGMKAANEAYKSHFDTFDTAKGPPGTIKRAIGVLSSGPSTPELQGAAQKVIDQKLASPTEGPATYYALRDAMGGPGSPGVKTLDDHLRQTILRTDETGSLVAKPAQIREFLNGPLQHVFTPEELAKIRLASAGQDILNGKLTYAEGAPNITGKLLRRGLGIAAGAGAAYLSPLHGALLPGMAETLGGIGGGISEGVIEPIIAGNQLRREMSGAPAVGGVLDVPAVAGAVTSGTARAIPVARPLEHQEPENKGSSPAEAVAALPDIDLSTVKGPFEAAPVPKAAEPARGVDPWAKYQTEPNPEQPADDLSTVPGPDDRQERARGGKVDPDIEHLVQRLMSMTKHAKSRSTEATKPLLNMPDEMVVKALDVAQRNI